VYERGIRERGVWERVYGRGVYGRGCAYCSQQHFFVQVAFGRFEKYVLVKRNHDSGAEGTTWHAGTKLLGSLQVRGCRLLSKFDVVSG
jgi:hypothetical protein